MKVLLREVESEDLELIMAWRSNPLIYKNFYIQQEPLVWKEHFDYWSNLPSSRKTWMIRVDDEGTRARNVGLISLHELDTDCPEVDIFIGETTLWGKGVGGKALEQVLGLLEPGGKKKVRARILFENERSKRVFRSAGFKVVGEGRPGEYIYEKLLI